MHHFIFTEKDTFITNRKTLDAVNFGVDEVLEIGTKTLLTGGTYVERALLKFDITEISKSVADGSITDPKFKLKLKVCKESDLPGEYTIYALPVSQSWVGGDGYLFDGGSATGASWLYRDKNGGTPWYTYSTASFSNVDFIGEPSRSETAFSFGGGTWYTASAVCSQSFRYSTSDVDMDITSIVMNWISGSIPNEGIILVSSDELQASTGFNLKFFSQNTNTIYSPLLDVMWNDTTFVTGSEGTGSLSALDLGRPFSIVLQNLHPEYKAGDIVKVGVFGRKQAPLKTFVKGTQQQEYIVPEFLPTTSYFALKDNGTGEIVMNFDEYTKLSCEYPYGNYFIVDTTGLAQERYYEILIKVRDGQYVYTIATGRTFKITR